MKLKMQQEHLKNKLLNPIYLPKYESHLIYIFLFLKDRKLIRISRSQCLDIILPPVCDEIRVYPFLTLDLAKAFEAKVRYFYDKGSLARVPPNES